MGKPMVNLAAWPTSDDAASAGGAHRRAAAVRRRRVGLDPSTMSTTQESLAVPLDRLGVLSRMGKMVI